MSLFSILSTSSQSLHVHRARTEVAAHNIANVATPGYTRRRADLVDMPEVLLGGARIGAGVGINGVSRLRDRFLEAEVASTYARAGAARAESGALVRLRAFDVDSPLHVSTALSAFFSSLRDVSLHPENTGVRAAAVGQAGVLASAIRTSATATEATRQGIDVEVKALANDASALAAEIARLNGAIRIEAASGHAPNDLLDARMRAAERLSEITGATVIPDDDGNMNLALPGGTAVVVGTVAASFDTVVDATNRGHVNVRVISPTGTPRALSSAELSGELGGLLVARDDVLRQVSEGLDVFASELAAAMNAAHASNFGLDGVSGRPLFDVGATLEGSALRFTVDAAVAADPNALAASNDAAALPGNNEGILQLLALEDTVLPNGLTPGSTLVSLIGSFAARTQRAAAVENQEVALKTRLDELRSEVSGVSLDEELITLTEAQRAFEAVSKVIQTADSLLDAVIKLK
jgi:flagellar hook-associated protein 1 FlgK